MGALPKWQEYKDPHQNMTKYVARVVNKDGVLEFVNGITALEIPMKFVRRWIVYRLKIGEEWMTIICVPTLIALQPREIASRNHHLCMTEVISM